MIQYFSEMLLKNSQNGGRDMLYKNLSGYLREKYGKRLSKICIDGGFSCPNRDGKCGIGGCTYCGERGAGEHIDPRGSIEEQVRSALSNAKSDAKFIAYFQNFTNTYAPVSILRERYDAALFDKRVVLLAVGTRPDCIDEGVAELLSSYRDRVDVWVELGLQTSSDVTAKRINRGYETAVFLRAAQILRQYGIPFVVHIMIGLPGEGESEAFDTVSVVNSVHPFGVKIHSTYVMGGTVLEDEYRRGEYTPIERDDYVRICANCIARLSPDVILHRITGDCPRDMLVAPTWNTDKNGIISDINRYMEENGLFQGSMFSE